MKSLAPRANFQVENTLTEAGGTMAIDLVFNGMNDFRPEQIVQQVEPLRKLVEARERLTDLRNKISNSERLEDLLDEVLKTRIKYKRSVWRLVMNNYNAATAMDTALEEHSLLDSIVERSRIARTEKNMIVLKV